MSANTAMIGELRTDFRSVKLGRILTFDHRQQRLAEAVGLKLIRA